MNLDDMKVFLTIARSGSLTAAAQSLYVSQPALSKRLTRFEQELGAPLFERGQGSRALSLTPAGKMLLPFAEKWDDLQQEISMLHDLASRVHFFVDTDTSLGDCLLPGEIILRARDSRSCYTAVQDQTTSVAFVVQEQFSQALTTRPLLSERMVLLTCNAALTGPVNAADLPREREIVVPWNADFMRWRQQRLSISRHPNVSLSSVPMALPFLRAGGWLVAPQTAADSAIEAWQDLRCLPLLDPPPARTVYCVEETGRHHPATDLLLEILRSEFKGRSGIHWLMGA